MFRGEISFIDNIRPFTLIEFSKNYIIKKYYILIEYTLKFE
jgi:hypothetical protein